MTITTNLSLMEIALASQFADARTDQDSYSFRGQSNKDKVRQDIFIGACGEIACYNFLRSKSPQITPPDFQLYKKEKKSFEPDMKWAENGIHVKSFNKEFLKKREISFIFQKEDPLFKIFNLKDVLMITVVCPKSCEVEIRGIFLIKDIVDKELIKEPLLDKFKANKSAIYYSDLKTLNNKMELL